MKTKRNLSLKYICWIFAVVFVGMIVAPALAWEAVHNYSSSGNQTTAFTPAYAGVHFIRVVAPSTGMLYAKISTFTESETIRVQAFAQNGGVVCDNGYVPTGLTTQFKTNCSHSGLGNAMGVGYDNYSSWKNVTCPPESED